MQVIGKAVGDVQPNDASDVTLIQAALVKIARPPAKGRVAGPYLSSYSGTFGKGTAEAITAFQNDHKLSGAQVTGGRVNPGDATFQALAAALPRDVADLRVLPHARTADCRRRHDPASAHRAPGPRCSPTRSGAETGTGSPSTESAPTGSAR